MIGISSIVGFSGNFRLSHSLMGELKRAKIEVLCQIKGNDTASCSSKYWHSTSYLGLSPQVITDEWNDYIRNLNAVDIMLTNQSDSLVWDWKKANGKLMTKWAYEALIEEFVST